jgi:hypothetical protein
MACIAAKYSKSKYKYVQNLNLNGKDYWTVNITGVSKPKFETEKEAAIAVDKYFLSKGKDPVNVLVRKSV